MLDAPPRDRGLRSERILCSERKGLRSGVPSLLEAECRQGGRRGARGTVSSARAVPAASVTTRFDIDGHGQAALEDVCP